MHELDSFRDSGLGRSSGSTHWLIMLPRIGSSKDNYSPFIQSQRLALISTRTEPHYRTAFNAANQRTYH